LGKKHSYNYIYSFFEKQGCELLSKEYTGNRQKLEFICSCENKNAVVTFHDFKRGQRCNECRFKRMAEKQKHSYEYVCNYFKEHGCELKSKEYVNARTPLEYICECGNLGKTSFDNFQHGQRCSICRYIKMGNTIRKYTYEDVDFFLKLHDCELLTLKSEYKNCHQVLDYICSCGNINKCSFSQFMITQQCRNCVGTNRYDYDYVKNYFEENDCVLLSKTYKNNQIPLDYICSCGNKSKINFGSFLNGCRCKKCGRIKSSEKQKYSYEFVKNTFKENECILLTKEYKNCKQKLEYICSCGNRTEISFDNFMQGKRCVECSESKGEKKVKEVLMNKNLIFERQYTFPDCRRIELLRFDFAILNNKGNLIFLVEYDGEYHYLPIDGEDNLKYQQENDEIKNVYCKKNNILLLRIPYWEFDNIENILDVFLNKLGVSNE